FNVSGGRCERCEGDGMIRIEMQFLADLYVRCDACQGRRYNSATLDIKYHDKNIADVLDMPIDEAYRFFARHPQIMRRLKLLKDVGLGYLRLGQSATTLSGGEAQRVKLAAELGRPETQSTMYLLDEPTTGLHFADVEQLVKVLRRLVSAGNTVVVIEHNLDVIGNADWVIDLGPEGGDRGGELVFAGPARDLARHPHSHTGMFLARWFSGLTARPPDTSVMALAS
ncbi:ATP-binding cassette domain-containing protein, partial [bacterium]|nr:ATP-binding cassette domain-containing protein [bacterium]